MSGKLMGQIYGLKLTPAKREILLAMAENADDDGGNCRPGVPYIAWKVDLSDRQVQRVQQQLIRDGILVIVEKPVRKPVVYHINLSAGTAKEPFRTREQRKGDILSISEGDNLSNLQGDILSENGARVTSHGKNENAEGDMGTGKMTSTHIKEEPLKAKEKEKEKELFSISGVPDNPAEMISPELQTQARNMLAALVAKVSRPEPRAFTDEEIQAQVAIIQARYGNRQAQAEVQT